MTQDTIEFNSVKTSHGTEINSGPLGIRDQVGVDEFGGIVNAVDIDWNSAILPNGNPEDATDLTINTTGELHRVIINTGSPMWAN